MKKRHESIAVGARALTVVLALATFTALAAGNYVTVEGDKTTCDVFLDRKQVRQIKPTLTKGNSRWDEITERCPNFLKKESWMPAPRADFDDYALFAVDIDNDGKKDTVLYRRYDKDHYTSSVVNGKESRKRDGVESSEDFHAIDLKSCTMEPVFAAYASNRLIAVRGETYIENTNPFDMHKTKAIYKKRPGKVIGESQQAAMCLFEMRSPTKGGSK